VPEKCGEMFRRLELPGADFTNSSAAVIYGQSLKNVTYEFISNVFFSNIKIKKFGPLLSDKFLSVVFGRHFVHNFRNLQIYKLVRKHFDRS
jgi:hypothetical protein